MEKVNTCVALVVTSLSQHGYGGGDVKSSLISTLGRIGLEKKNQMSLKNIFSEVNNRLV